MGGNLIQFGFFRLDFLGYVWRDIALWMGQVQKSRIIRAHCTITETKPEALWIVVPWIALVCEIRKVWTLFPEKHMWFRPSQKARG